MVGYGSSQGRKKLSVAEFELLGDRLITCQVGMMEIIQQRAPLTDHFQQTTAGTVVFVVFLQMFGQVINSLGQKSDLHVSGPCVLFVQLEPCYRLSFFHILFDQYLVNGYIRFQPNPCKVLFFRFPQRNAGRILRSGCLLNPNPNLTRNLNLLPS
jgi:hypothetical protein